MFSHQIFGIFFFLSFLVMSRHLFVFFASFFKLLYRLCLQYKLLHYDFSSQSLTLNFKIIGVGFAMSKLVSRSSAFINRKISSNVHLLFIYILLRIFTLHYVTLRPLTL